MLRNKSMTKRLENLDKDASEQPTRSQEEAMRQYRKFEKLAVQRGQKESTT